MKKRKVIGTVAGVIGLIIAGTAALTCFRKRR